MSQKAWQHFEDAARRRAGWVPWHRLVLACAILALVLVQFGSGVASAAIGAVDPAELAALSAATGTHIILCQHAADSPVDPAAPAHDPDHCKDSCPLCRVAGPEPALLARAGEIRRDVAVVPAGLVAHREFVLARRRFVSDTQARAPPIAL